MTPGKLLKALRDRVKGEVLDDEASLERASIDAGIFRVRPLVVVEPRDAEDLRTILDVAREEGIPVTPRGGGTNTGGAAVGPGIVVSFRPSGPMSRILRVEERDGGVEVTAQAGSRHDEVQRALAERGSFLPSDPSSGPLSLIGGNVATKASGPHALRYGAIDRYLTSLRVMLSDGTLLDTSRIGGLPASLTSSLAALRAELMGERACASVLERRAGRKSSSGYNLSALLRDARPESWVTGLLAGSVGTLGVLVDATLRGKPVRAGRAALLLCARTLDGACRLALLLRDLGAAAVELMNDRSLELVRRRFPEAALPEPAGHLLLAEMDGEHALDDAHRAASLAVASGEGLAGPPVVRTDPEEIGGLWKARKLMLPLLRAQGGREAALSVVNDVGVPVERLAEAILEIERIFERHNLDAFIYGHAGDGNLHLRPLFDTTESGLRSLVAAVADEVYGCVLELDGTVTGEHGMGMLRAPFLEREWGRPIVSVMERVKRIFDPAGILNPGAMFPALGLREALERHFSPR